MPPAEDARLILELALRHEQSLKMAMNPAFPQENWGFLAQQEVENLLKGLIVLQGKEPPLTHDLGRLAMQAAIALPEELLNLETFAVGARYNPADTDLPEPRERLLGRIQNLRRLLEEGIREQEGA
jgi:HEPN domain-containing protein